MLRNNFLEEITFFNIWLFVVAVISYSFGAFILKTVMLPCTDRVRGSLGPCAWDLSFALEEMVSGRPEPQVTFI